jgi:hypothetical protein
MASSLQTWVSYLVCGTGHFIQSRPRTATVVALRATADLHVFD